MDRKIRIRAADIEVPKHNPFEHDLLDRQRPAEILTELVDSIAGPCVLAVDAAWGAGKTTFLKMWAQHLRNQGFPSSASMRGRPIMPAIRSWPWSRSEWSGSYSSAARRWRSVSILSRSTPARCTQSSASDWEIDSKSP